MGLIFKQLSLAIKSYIEETIDWKKAIIEPGKPTASVKLGPLSGEEMEMILLKLDQLAISKNNEAIAIMLAEEMDSILTAVRWVKTETKSPFRGILGVGAELDIGWLQPVDVGGTLLNPAATAAKGLYGGTSAGVYSWLNTFTANTAANLLPEQTMAEEAAVIHLGAIDPMEVPKINKVKFTLAGIAAPVQRVDFNIREGFGTQQLPFVRFEKPVLVGPEKKQRIDVTPYVSGDSKFELLSLLIARAQDLTT